MLDTYNQKVKDISCTITTRVNASNEIYVVVADEKKKVNTQINRWKELKEISFQQMVYVLA